MKIYIATLPDGFFGSTGQSWHSLNVRKLVSLLNYDARVITINDLISIDFDKKDIVIYTSSDEVNIRLYLRDMMYFINDKCRILPSYDMLMSHENKGFQQLFRSDLGIGNLQGNYFFDIDDSNFALPKILKKIDGAGSRNVFLVKDKSDKSDIRKKYFTVSNKRKIIRMQRKIKLRNKEFLIYKYRHKGFNRFIEQEFIPDLTNDFKILVFGDRYYSLKRNIKEGDFRASGSKSVEHVRPPDAVLDYAKNIFNKIKNPYASLDIAQSAEGCHLIEFQGTNFSPGTLLKAPSRYLYKDEQWITEKNDGDLEENFAHALNIFIESNPPLP